MSDETNTSFEPIYFAGFKIDNNGVEVFVVLRTFPPEEFMKGRTHLSAFEQAQALSDYDSTIERAKKLSLTLQEQERYSGMPVAQFEESLVSDYGGGEEGGKNARLIIEEIRSLSIKCRMLQNVVPL